jgi:hypothetical protein
MVGRGKSLGLRQAKAAGLYQRGSLTRLLHVPHTLGIPNPRCKVRVSGEVVAKLVLCQHVAIVGKRMFRFPGSVGNWISPPFDIVLISSSSSSVVKNGFDLVYFFSFQEGRWWFSEVFAVDVVLFVGFQQGRVKDVMDSP